MRGTGKCGLHAQRPVGMEGPDCMCAWTGWCRRREVGQLCPFVREWRVGGNKVSSRAGVEDSRGWIFAGRKHNLIQFEFVLMS
jgi:hypothetical protein